MKKNIAIIIMLFMATGSVFSQVVEDTKTVTVGNSRDLPGFIHPLTKTESRIHEAPDQLTYWNKSIKPTPGGSNADLPSLSPGLFKGPKKGETADYTFKIVCSGVQNLEQGNLKPFKNNMVVEYTYNFQCELLVIDKNEKVLHTFILSDISTQHAAIVHIGFLADVELYPKSLVIAPSPNRVAPNDVITKFFETNKSAINTRIEYNQLYECMKNAAFAICCTYYYSKLQYPPYVVIANHKKNDPQFVVLDEATTKLSNQIIEAFMEPMTLELQNELLKSARYFAQGYNDSSNKETKKLFSYNSAIAYLLGGDTANAYTQFKVTKAVTGALAMSALFFDAIYPYMKYINDLKGNDSDTFTLLPDRRDASEQIEQEK